MRTNQFRQQKCSAFTLVELLVVIGIIALLISILLPALSKARWQANSVDCQARLHQIGLTLDIYISNNKGLIPWGVIDRGGTEPVTNPIPDPQLWWWYDELAQSALSQKLTFSTGPYGFAQNLTPMFNDRDSIPTPDGSTPCVYTGNPRVFWQNTDYDLDPTCPDMNAASDGGYDGNLVPQFKASHLGNGSAFIVWDGPQCLDQNGNAYGIATELDGNRLRFGHYFDSMYAPAPETYMRPVSPGLPNQQTSVPILVAAQKKWNHDQPTYQNWVHLRFRHINNTSMNALCGDGHVATRVVGAAMVTDFIVAHSQY